MIRAIWKLLLLLPGGEEKEADDGRMEDVETELAIGIGTRWPPRSIMDRMTSKHQDS